jgi:hypothetical protein
VRMSRIALRNRRARRSSMTLVSLARAGMPRV